MRLTDLERRVRDQAWPAPSPELRARVLTEASVVPPSFAPSNRVYSRGGDDAGAWPCAAPGHRWRRAGVALVLTLLVMAGACTGWDLWADRQLDAEIARFEARYGSLNITTLFVPSVPPADNRAHAMLKELPYRHDQADRRRGECQLRRQVHRQKWVQHGEADV